MSRRLLTIIALAALLVVIVLARGRSDADQPQPPPTTASDHGQVEPLPAPTTPTTDAGDTAAAEAAARGFLEHVYLPWTGGRTPTLPSSSSWADEQAREMLLVAVRLPPPIPLPETRIVAFRPGLGRTQTLVPLIATVGRSDGARVEVALAVRSELAGWRVSYVEPSLEPASRG